MVTFIHDHVFFEYNGQFYTSGSLNSEVMKRYIGPFGGIRLITRCRKVNSVKEGSEPSSIENTEFVSVPNYKSIKTIMNYLKAKKVIKEEVRNAKYIILRSSSFANIAARYAKRYNKPYLVEVVGCAWDATWNYSVLGKVLAPFSYLAQRKTVREADYAIYVTEKFLQGRYPTKGKDTNCSNVALTEFDETTLKNRLKKINYLAKDEKIIVGTTAAVDVRYKGQQYVINALGKLKEQGNINFEYQIVGGGNQSYLKSVAEKYGVLDQVKFLGSKSHNKVFEWLDTIDIYVQPSRQEGLPRGLIEAMSRGIPAFGARTAGIPELLEEKFLFKNTNENIEGICSILLSMSKETMISQAKRNYEESKKYKKEVIEKRRKKFFSKLINEEK